MILHATVGFYGKFICLYKISSFPDTKTVIFGFLKIFSNLDFHNSMVTV